MAPSRNGLVSNTCERSPKGRSTKGKLYIEMLFAVLQTQNISVLLFIIVYDRIFGRLYESFGVLKPRKKSFLMDENSEMPTHGCVALCRKFYRDKVTGAKISYLRFPLEENLRKQWIHAVRRDMGKNFSDQIQTRFARGTSRLKISRLLQRTWCL